MSLKRVKIVSMPDHPTRWRAWYGDTEIQGMVAISFEQTVMQPPTVTFTVIAAVDIEVEAAAEIVTDAPDSDAA